MTAWENAVNIHRKGRQPLSALLAVGLIAAAHAGHWQTQQGRIQFMGAVLPTTEPGTLPAAGGAASRVNGAAETHVESLEVARHHAPPELLDYFASYASRDTSVVITTYN